MVNIVCLKWGTKYGPEYVNKLYAGVKRNTTKKFKFWCFTEDAIGIDKEINVVPLVYADRLDIWWNKIYLFSDNIPIPKNEQIFYVDLDTLIVGNIDLLLNEEINKIVVLRDFYRGLAKTATAMGSGLMSWKNGHYTRIWDEFIKDPQDAILRCRPHGDQRWLELVLDGAWDTWQDLWPDQVVSFKVHCQNGLPPDAKVVCYHGRPSIPESAVIETKVWRCQISPQPWVLNYWKN